MRVENNFSTYLFVFFCARTLLKVYVNLKEHIKIILKIHVMTPLTVWISKRSLSVFSPHFAHSSLINVFLIVSGLIMKHAERDFSTHSVVTTVSSLYLEPSHHDNGPLCFHLSHGHQNTGEICDISFSLSVSPSLSPGLRIALYNSLYSILATILMPPPHVCHLSHSSAQSAQCSVHFISPVSLSLFFRVHMVTINVEVSGQEI